MLRRFALAAALSLTAMVPASAATSYSFDTVLAGTGPAISFATLSITESGKDLLFTLSAPGLDAFGPTAFLGAIAVSAKLDGEVLNVSGGSPVSFSPGAGPTGSFGFRFDLTGPKQSRLTDGESVSWTWADAGVSAGVLTFAAHVQGVSRLGASDSIWYTGPVAAVPEPETYALLLAGLGIVGFVGRRHYRRHR
jgi:hypothetical protein